MVSVRVANVSDIISAKVFMRQNVMYLFVRQIFSEILENLVTYFTNEQRTIPIIEKCFVNQLFSLECFRSVHCSRLI